MPLFVYPFLALILPADIISSDWSPDRTFTCVIFDRSDAMQDTHIVPRPRGPTHVVDWGRFLPDRHHGRSGSPRRDRQRRSAAAR